MCPWSTGAKLILGGLSLLVRAQLAVCRSEMAVDWVLFYVVLHPLAGQPRFVHLGWQNSERLEMSQLLRDHAQNQDHHFYCALMLKQGVKK